ncbi:MAG TPA: thiamine pyrophosphate-binding protein, partial [Thermoleophilia bacterium]|nr:thiamine pyrophosphate-binding protein [Thermoleophilia bacterium]
MTKLSDYVVEFLVGKGVTDAFVVSGGGIMHLLDSLGAQARLRYTCNRHEQACAIAAEGYARTAGRPALCLVTNGPGAVNALSGIVGAWYDSLPMIVVSGQVRRDLIADFRLLRQRGPQEADLLAMAAPVTKHVASVSEPSEIRRELECAWHQATAGRPGPVWLELPVDVQALDVDPDELEPYRPPAPPAAADGAALAAQVRRAAAALRAAARPLVLCGSGVRLAGATDALDELLAAAPLPAVVPDSGKDLVPEDHPRNMGVFGPAGQRRANFAVQTCDCLLVLGAGLSSKKIGFAFDRFAPHAYTIAVDVDPDQLAHQVVTPDLAINADLAEFLPLFLDELRSAPLPPRDDWLAACRRWKERYPVMTADHRADTTHVGSYVFMDRLSDELTGDDVLVTGNGIDSVS